MSRTINISSDQDLVLRLQASDSEALKIIYEKYASALYHSAYNLLRNKEICEDLIHDLFFDLWMKRTAHNIVVLKPYLYTSIRNRVLMHLRASQSTVDIAELEFSEEVCSAEYLVNEKEIRQISGLEVSRLPEKCREIYQLSRLEQKSHKEIAILKGISIKTVENQITIALKRLRPALKDYITTLILMVLFSA